MTRSPIDTLIARAAAGDERAWRDLWDHVEDVLEGNRTIVRSVTERLREDDMARLRLYLALRDEQPSLAFDTWIRVLARAVREQESTVREGPQQSITIMRRAASDLDALELSALELWVQSSEDQAIARELGLRDERGAADLVRRALERLRRKVS